MLEWRSLEDVGCAFVAVAARASVGMTWLPTASALHAHAIPAWELDLVVMDPNCCSWVDERVCTPLTDPSCTTQAIFVLHGVYCLLGPWEHPPCAVGGLSGIFSYTVTAHTLVWDSISSCLHLPYVARHSQLKDIQHAC